MYNEENLITTKFFNNFQDNFDKKIILYGAGKNTEKLLEHINQEWIQGIMDIQKSGQTFCGRKILSEEEVLDIKPDFIVLICMPSTEEIVYNRIKKFTAENGIKVYNLEGKRLDTIHQNKKTFLEFLNTADDSMKRTIASLIQSSLSEDTLPEGDDRIFIENTEMLGYLFWGPVFMGYMIWMIKEVIKEKCDVILFQARDGYLLEKLYHRIVEAYSEISFPDAKYFLASRRASVVSGIRTERDIVIAAKYNYNGTKDNFLKVRFGIDGTEDEGTSLLECALRKKEQIFLRAEMERKNYITYLKNIHIAKYKKAALIDVTAMGTIQANLEHFVPVELEGFYFLKRESTTLEYNKIHVKSYYEPKGAYEIKENIFTFFRMMETVLASQEPSLVCFDSYGKPVYGEDVRTEKEKELILRIQSEIIHYAEDFLKLGLKWDELHDERDFCDEMLGFMKSEYLALNNDEVSTLIFEDGFSCVAGKACEQLKDEG